MSHHFPFLIRLCKKIGISPDKIIYACTDLIVMILCALIAYGLRVLQGDFVLWDLSSYTSLLLVFLLSPLLGCALGLYTSIPLPAHTTFYRSFLHVTFTYGIIVTVFFLARTGQFHSRFIFLLGWGLTCICLPIARAWVCHTFSRYPWWGFPLVVLDHTRIGRQLWHFLRRNPAYGFRPASFVHITPEMSEENVRTILEKASNKYPGAVAMVVYRGGTTDTFLAQINTYFTRILLVPVIEHSSTEVMRRFWLTPCTIGDITGLMVVQRLHDKRRLACKRFMDLVLCILGSVLLVPLGLLIILAIRLDSKGSAIYTQERIGRGGQKIRVHKFRTMVQNADQVLADHLAANPQLLEEWNKDHKLKDDPRVTRVGHFLRHTSLDELPQIVDVLLGTMSLVGPRPIVESEREKYGVVFHEYIRVRPGITGLWQISGRNDTTYEERVNFDFYYISNWSVWMDIWILAKTLPAVIHGKGAY